MSPLDEKETNPLITFRLPQNVGTVLNGAWYEKTDFYQLLNPQISQSMPNTTFPGRSRPCLLSLSNEVLYEIFEHLSYDPNGPDETDYNSPTCLALTCKFFARIAVHLKLANALFLTKEVQYEEQELAMLNLLDKGWNRDANLKACQLSRKFAHNTEIPSASFCETFGDLDPNMTVCRPCVKMAQRVLTNYWRRRKDPRVYVDGVKVKLGKNLDNLRYIWDAEKSAIHQREREMGKKVVPMMYRLAFETSVRHKPVGKREK